jgi:hypothetical protein
MARFFDLDKAADTLPELRSILTRLRDQRRELIRLRDEVLEQQAAVEASAEAGPGPGGSARAAEDVAELRRVRLRMQGVIDQMQAGVARIDELGITLREIETGLVDFPALVNGRQVWLCWRLGEDAIDWWHELSTGVAGRRQLSDLE